LHLKGRRRRSRIPTRRRGRKSMQEALVKKRKK